MRVYGVFFTRMPGEIYRATMVFVVFVSGDNLLFVNSVINHIRLFCQTGTIMLL